MARAKSHGRHPPHIEPLRWIGAYKLLKAALALVAGLMVLRLMHQDLPLVARRWMHRLHIDPTSVAGHLVLQRILAIRARRLEWLAVFLFAYVPVAIAEGIGLVLRRYWAEWLTVITTAALVPWEAFEFSRRPNIPRVIILLLNIAVVVYLVVRIRRDRRRHLRLTDVSENEAERGRR